jgi:hypothetical protein
VGRVSPDHHHIGYYRTQLNWRVACVVPWRSHGQVARRSRFSPTVTLMPTVALLRFTFLQKLGIFSNPEISPQKPERPLMFSLTLTLTLTLVLLIQPEKPPSDSTAIVDVLLVDIRCTCACPRLRLRLRCRGGECLVCFRLQASGMGLFYIRVNVKALVTVIKIYSEQYCFFVESSELRNPWYVDIKHTYIHTYIPVHIVCF